ncbi:response regulator transcription factor [Paenibacillus sp. JDR-2]|uniref:response regulator transcription factor n=1 Tax=Paenibacillus sp. (strain JDR-2) TaxID=324057 RepID=UPI0001664791|nr:response regulator [Paenibacillus sp. JDR-2]ACT04228.1 two component transcriptional regulator, AraC family [Paenibacillus sp. JDR-2]
MMYRVLLVDDEPLVRNDLRSLLDFRAHGFEICGEAQSAETALDMIGEQRPDVAILDVNMPGMNGVDLNRTIKQRYPAVQTIMLSSYDDYDYVRDCLKNGSVDYLLKHRLDKDTLLAMLEKAVQAGKSSEAASEADESSHFNAELVRSQISDLARGKAEAARELEGSIRRYGMYPQADLYAAAVLQIVPFLLLTESNTDVQTNRLVQQVVELMQQSLGDARERTAAYVEDGRIAVVFAIRERSEHAAASEAARSMSKLGHALEMYLNLKSTYAVGHVCNSLSQLGGSYASAERALDATTRAANPNAERGKGTRESRVALTIEEQKQLLLAIERLDGQGAQRLIASVFEPLRGLPLHSHAVQITVSELLHIGDKALKKGNRSPLGTTKDADRLPPRGELNRLGGVGELEKWLQSFYGVLLILLKEHHATGSYSRHVSQAIGFILERYSGIVTLELAAGFIGLNASYLSRIFKDETQSTFSEYVNRVRVDAARRLLESGQYTIKQVSDQVGFTTHNYFFKVFKEVTGMTPQAYWNSLGDGKAAAKEVVKYVE